MNHHDREHQHQHQFSGLDITISEARGMLAVRLCSYIARRPLSTSACRLIKRNELPPRPKIVEDDIEEVFIKGGGKGGQKINKTNSKVQLKHIPTGIVVSSQHTRSREQNRAKARELLALKVEELTAPEGESRAAVVAKYKQNKARKKKARSKKKYAALDAAKKEAAATATATADDGPGDR